MNSGGASDTVTSTSSGIHIAASQSLSVSDRVECIRKHVLQARPPGSLTTSQSLSKADFDAFLKLCEAEHAGDVEAVEAAGECGCPASSLIVFDITVESWSLIGSELSTVLVPAFDSPYAAIEPFAHSLRFFLNGFIISLCSRLLMTSLALNFAFRSSAMHAGVVLSLAYSRFQLFAKKIHRNHQRFSTCRFSTRLCSFFFLFFRMLCFMLPACVDVSLISQIPYDFSDIEVYRRNPNHPMLALPLSTDLVRSILIALPFFSCLVA